MAKALVMSMPLWLLLAPLCAANMQYTFTSNGTCPGSGRPWICDPVDQVICGEETSRSWAYCCPVAYDYCSTGSTPCSGDGGEAGEGQIDCEAYGVKWCCSEEYETCTQRANQTNVCLYDKEDNPYVGFDATLANKAWSSVISASPTATFTGDDILFLVAAASAEQSSTASPSETSTPTGMSSSGATAPVPSATGSADGHKSISGGAIAGIVIGVIAALAIGAGALFLLRKRRNGTSNFQAGGYQPAPPFSGYQGQVWEGERKEALTTTTPPLELASYERRAEMGTNNDGRIELGTNNEGPYEMPGR